MKGKNKGYVFEDKGKFYARITLTDSNGKRRNIKRTAKSKQEARAILKQLAEQLEMNGSKTIDALQMTFNRLADFYETNYLKPPKFVGNQRVEGLSSFQHIKYYLPIFRQFFGNKPLRNLLHSDLVKFRTKRLLTETHHKRPRSITTVNRELEHLRRMFNIAMQNQWIVKNPFSCGDSLILTSFERRRERILTIEEEKRLLEVCNSPERLHLKPLLIGLLDTGCRKGEMQKLVWNDVDLDNRIITIQAKNTKTLKTRQIATTQRFWNELISLWKNSEKQLDSRVFTICGNIRRSFATACRLADIKYGGIDGLTIHSLRHTAATRLVKGNLPIQMVGRILGHTQPQTTYRYLSANDETLYQAASILESIQENNNREVNSELIN